ncbi:acyl-ACP--UDP-N- acetylglucosamine O-acyltransferase [Sulfurimonas sp. HSL-3221]|uniref:acyl-ACP--UDP-N- acetylglucosamine O-acyltransferase n=1 Tax=Sulfurimonadaceae TaxID=2771471 RepID=UPI001E2B3643|nr:acyl-ACP--UDP-N- acetylglucosamine O-acyltransferase [Sulfurimonas sp. HSL-3221]UFS61438.1 acyl-ACP--UDP-N- acetylglucosamine O-acyltransferase [Sulfurimonas sp. HSL-3221]
MIHPTAVIAPGAVIAPDAHIGPFCSIGADCVIGAGVRLEAHVVLEGPVTLEAGVRLFSFVKIGNGLAPVTLGRGTFVREFCQIATQNDTADAVAIGEENFIMAYVQLFPGVTLGANCILTNAVTMQARSRCEERVIIGGLSTVAAECTIGTGVMVGGASNLQYDVPPFCLVEGNPATVRGLNLIGMRRRFEDREDIESVRRCFRQLHKQFDPHTAAEMSEALENPQAKRFTGFIAAHRCA